MKKLSFALIFSAGVMLSGCGIFRDYSEYELNSSSDTVEIRHYKNICLTQRNGAACEYVATRGTYLSDEMKEKYLRLGCNYGYDISCKLLENSFYSSSCHLNNDINDCNGKADFIDKTTKKYFDTMNYEFYSNLYNGLKFSEKGCKLNNSESCAKGAEFAVALDIASIDLNNDANTRIHYYWVSQNYFKDLCEKGISAACKRVYSKEFTKKYIERQLSQ